MLKRIAVLFFCLLYTIVIYAQEKGINRKRVSPFIANYIKKEFPTASSIKYYREKEGDSIYIESEFKYNRDKYALKFYNESLVEVEIFLKFQEIPVNIQQAIKSSLDSLFLKYKILSCEEVNPQLTISYEINIKSGSGKLSGFYELFFDKSGRLLKKREVIIKPIPSQF
jgi:hypothetical protein